MVISYSIPPRKKRDSERWDARMYSHIVAILLSKLIVESFVEAFSKIKIDLRVNMVDYKWATEDPLLNSRL